MGAADWSFHELGGHRAELGESPVVAADGLHVWWVDISGKAVLRTRIGDGATECWPAPEQVGFVQPIGETYIVGMESGLFEFRPATGAFGLIDGTRLPPGMRYNDATLDARGRLWLGTMRSANDAPEGAFHVLDSAGRLHFVASGYYTPNGLAADTERGILYFSDSHPQARRVWTAKIAEDGLSLGERQLFIDFNKREGRPDGASLDQDGRYWIATLEAGSIAAFDRNGQLVAEVGVPVRVPTKPVFSPSGDVFVTSKAVDADASGGRLLMGERQRVAT